MASNPSLNEFTNMLKAYHTNFFFDNKQILNYLQDIKAEDGNFFDSMVKKIFRLEINKEGVLLFRKNNKNTDIANRYDKIFSTILVAIETLFYISKSNKDYADIYKGIYNIKIITDPPSADIAKLVTSINNLVTTKYRFDSNILYIYTNKYATDIDFDKYKFTPVLNNNIDDITIIKNYLYFMISFNEYNLKSQLYSFYYYYMLVKQFGLFYFFSEIIIDSGSNNIVCDYFNNIFSANLKELKNAIDFLISSAGKNTVLLQVNAKCIDDCPVILDILYTNTEEFIIVEKDNIFSENYYVMLDDKIYEILNISYMDIPNVDYYKVVKNITLKATSVNTKDCTIQGSYPIASINKNQTKLIQVRSKTISDMRKDFINSGIQLKSLNSDIEKSKNKINKIVKDYNKQNSVNKNIDLRLQIYNIILIIIAIVFLLLYFINFEKTLKIYTSCGILAIIIIMLIINYYLKYDYIEHFHVPTVDSTACSQIKVDSPMNTKITFINNNITIFTEYATSIMVSFHIYLSTLDSLDLFKKMSGSLKNELKTFTEHENYYKYKQSIDKNTIDIMKHDMIENTGYINMITFIFLILSVYFICYYYKPEHIKVYNIITIILLIINICIYYFVIIQPVRTKSRNKYWMKPGDNTIINTRS
jgi:hypothetical protein